jgi:hypothetical protein
MAAVLLLHGLISLCSNRSSDTDTIKVRRRSISMEASERKICLGKAADEEGNEKVLIGYDENL